MTRLARFALPAAAILLLAANAAIAWPFLAWEAPTDYSEGLLVRQADRIREGKSPFEEGPMAFRAPVSYPPVYAALASLVPLPRSPLPLRALALLATLGTALLLVRFARAKGARRPWALGALALGAPASTVGHSGLPDPLAAALAVAALLVLAGASRRRALADAVAALLFVAAALVKPSAVTLCAGAVLYLALAEPRRGARLLGLLAAAGAVAGAILAGVLGPRLLRDVMAMGYGGFSLERAPIAVSGLWPGLPFLPLLWRAARPGEGEKAPGERILAAAALSGWALAFAAGFKVGSSWRYFLEPAAATVAWLAVSAAREDALAVPGRLRLIAIGWAAAWGAVYAAGGFVYLDRKQTAIEAIRPELRAFDGRLHVEEPILDYRWNGELSFAPYEVRYAEESGREGSLAIAAEIDGLRYERMVFEFDPCDAGALHAITRTQGRHDVRYGGAIRQSICGRYERVKRVEPYSVYAPRR